MKGRLAITKSENEFSRIKRFFAEGDVILTSSEEGLLMRLTFMHKMFMQRKFREETIVDKASKMFSIAATTARKDYYKMQELYGGIITANRKFLLHHHAESIQQTINEFRVDKSLSYLLPKLYDSYTKAIAAMPDEVKSTQLPPPIMNFFVVPGQEVGTVPVDDVLAKIEARKKARHDHEYIEPLKEGTDDGTAV